MRSKEDAQDYRYFPDPDLPPLVIGEAWIARLKSELPELPEAMKTRFEAHYGLAPHDARALVASRALAAYFEAAVAALGEGDASSAKLAANWIQGEVSAAINRAEIDIAATPVSAAQLARLLQRVRDGTISGKIAKEVFDAMWTGEAVGVDAADTIIQKRGLEQISDVETIERIVDEVLAANAAIVAEFRAGREKAFNSLVGKAMQATRGKANPAQVNAILKTKLGA
jgi:aspartyl-tRNA(Asn)/glutamyl-tRNA(Gln) amidotransferase subunit B